jgi:hypothetical protein
MALTLGLLSACGQDVGLIDRTQPGLLHKSALDGEWFMRRTVVDAPYDMGATFIGEQDEVRRIRWEMVENHLIAWRVNPHIENTPDAAPEAVFALEGHVDVIREYNASTGEQTNVLIEDSADRVWYERDYIRVDWSQNLVTNFNFWVEQLDQDPVAYFVENGSNDDRVLVGVRDSDGWWVDEQDTMAIRDMAQIEYLDVVTRVFIKPEEVGFEDWWGDITYEPACWYYGNFDCAPGVVTIRNSFLRVEAALSNYEPLDYPDNQLVRDGEGAPVRVRWTEAGDRERIDTTEAGGGRGQGRGTPGGASPTNPWEDGDSATVRLPFFDKFGYFRTERHGYDGYYGEVESNRIFLINRWNLWTESFDGDGQPIPYAQREVKPVVYYLSPGFPAELRDTAMGVAATWNEAFRDTISSLTGSEAPAVVFELRDNTRQVDEASGEVLRRGEVNGDLRYSHLWWVKEPTRVGLLGYGPSASDPLTGEIFASDAYVYGEAVSGYAAHGRDIIELVNGKIDPEEFALGANIQTYLHKLAGGGSAAGTQGKEAYQAFAQKHATQGHSKGGANAKGEQAQRGPKPTMATAKTKKGIEKLLRPAGWGDARLQQVAGTGLEDLLMGDPAIVGLKGMGLVDPSTPVSALPAGLRGRVSPTNWASPAHHRIALARFRSFAERNMMMATFFDDAVAGLALSLKDTPSDDIIATLNAHIFRSTAEHEVGHTLGLRHNFEGSSDALNYHDTYWQLRGAEPTPFAPLTQVEKDGRIREYQYSSIMDYGSRFNTDIQGLGKYDVAAIKFGYGQLVETFLEPPYEPLTTIWEAADGTYYQDFGLEEALRKFRHWTSIPWMWDSLDGIKDRVDVPFTREAAVLMGDPTGATSLEAQLSGDAPWLYEEVPYRFCSDEYTFGTPTCNAFDSGADAWEIVTDTIDRYRNYYWFNNFKRDRVFFDEWDYMDSAWWNTFIFVKNMHDHWVIGQWYDADVWDWGTQWDPEFTWVEELPWAEAIDGGLEFSAAARESFTFLQEVIATPAPGAYWYDPDEDYWWAMDTAPAPLCGDVWAYEVPDEYCADYNLGLGPARHFESIYDTESGYYFYERLKWIGSFYDKVLALETLTSPDTYFLGVDTSATSDQWAISMYGSFKNEVQTLFTGIAADAYADYGGTFDESGDFVAPNPFDEYGDFGPLMAQQGPVDPSTSFTVQLYALWFGMSWLNVNYDNTFNDLAQIWLKGSGEGFEPADTDPALRVEFANPFNNRTYVTLRSADPSLRGAGEAMLDEAQRWLDAYELPLDDPVEDAWKPDYYKWRVTNMVENIEVVRGMYDLYGYLWF